MYVWHVIWHNIIHELDLVFEHVSNFYKRQRSHRKKFTQSLSQAKCSGSPWNVQCTISGTHWIHNKVMFHSLRGAEDTWNHLLTFILKQRVGKRRIWRKKNTRATMYLHTSDCYRKLSLWIMSVIHITACMMYFLWLMCLVSWIIMTDSCISSFQIFSMNLLFS